MTERNDVSGSWLSHLLLLFRLGSSPWAWGAGARLLIAALVIGIIGVTTDQLSAAGVAFLGAAVAGIVHAAPNTRSRFALLLAQAVGMTFGLLVGFLLPSQSVVIVVVAVALGMLSGMVGAMGPACTVLAMTTLVGFSYGQFGGNSLAGWQQILCATAGGAIIFVAYALPELLMPERSVRKSIASSYDAAAALLECIGGDRMQRMNAKIVLSNALNMAQSRVGSRQPLARTSKRWNKNAIALSAVEQAAISVAGICGEGHPVPIEVPATLRRVADDVCATCVVSRASDISSVAGNSASVAALASALDGVLVTEPSPTRFSQRPPVRDRIAAGIDAMKRHGSLIRGARVALCFGIATAIVLLLDDPNHSFWLVLTVALVIRPELGSVYVRTTNRVVGTIAGVLAAFPLLFLLPQPWPLAIGTAVAFGFAAASFPKNYALASAGVTAAVMFAFSLGGPSIQYPVDRLIDTISGCLIAFIFGYLIWPAHRLPPKSTQLDGVISALRQYLQAVRAAGEVAEIQGSVYRNLQSTRIAILATRLEPPPVGPAMQQRVSAIIELGDTADQITAMSLQPGLVTSAEFAVLDQRLHGYRTNANR